MKPKDIYVVRVLRVPGVPRTRMLAYIQEAIEVWGGQLRPQMGERDDDPLGPPCPLMERGVVKVWAVRRDTLLFPIKDWY